ncbi:hypothetical protein [Cystobacter ferrugineus]|nr:hypothetical protein [Cystobacter ferrugineus]
MGNSSTHQAGVEGTRSRPLVRKPAIPLMDEATSFTRRWQPSSAHES